MYRGDFLEGMAAGSEMELGLQRGVQGSCQGPRCHSSVPVLQLQWPQEAQAFSGLRLCEGDFSQRSGLAS